MESTERNPILVNIKLRGTNKQIDWENTCLNFLSLSEFS